MENPASSDESSGPFVTNGFEVVGGAIMSLGGYLLAAFTGTAIHAAKNGPGDGSMPSMTFSVTLALVGLVLLGVGFATCRNWLKDSEDPVSSFDLFSVLICDPVPFALGIYYLFQRRSRGPRLMLTHALIVFVKFTVAALAWNPNL